MPRQRRIEDLGAIYHALNRGDRREPIFQDDADRRRCLQTLGEAWAQTDLPREILGQRTVWPGCDFTTKQPNRTNLVSKVRSDPFTNFKRFLAFAPIALVLVLLSGCIAEKQIAMSDKQLFDSVKTGMSRADVEKLLGKRPKIEKWQSPVALTSILVVYSAENVVQSKKFYGGNN